MTKFTKICHVAIVMGVVSLLAASTGGFHYQKQITFTECSLVVSCLFD